ncbi:MAG: cryptochrome/photolyase family protein [Deltaproteobacteria bacterium]|nr:cryptochrome/photolyase family protein [Deltaproteobacteria bacterium]
MGHFKKELAKHQARAGKRKWLFIPYDQLNDKIGPLSREAPNGLGIVLIENPWKAARRPYHKQKLALILANLRHFALEQARRGVAVRHLVGDGPYRNALAPLIGELGPLRVMLPSERELRADLQPLIQTGGLWVIPHEGWLTTEEHFKESAPQGPPWRMDAFYRGVRRETGILMKAGKPAGGKFSFDPENRLSWKGAPPAPEPPTFSLDPIKEEVGRLVQERFSHHPGRLDFTRIPSTRKDAEALWAWAKEQCLPHFGPYEDALSTRSRGLFHTRISSLLNIHRLLPSRVVSDVLAMNLPLASREGFIRQVLGWREFVRHVHTSTDGFRAISPGAPTILPVPGDGGYSRWAGRPWKATSPPGDPDGGASPSSLGGNTPLPPAYWGKASGLACLDQVVSDVWEEGYSHHITRLMVLCNIATLLDVNPRELTDWFWSAYTDAYDWVVEPNVLGMGTFALGGLMTTKPYVSGAAYIHRMSDYCGACPFNPKADCPITTLYWAFLQRHRNRLGNNPRLRMPMASLRRRSASQRLKDQNTFVAVRDRLMNGEALTAKTLR